VLLEPLARGRPRHDETVHAFAARRIGREAADVLVQAMVSGVFAGDARRLSLRATFPKMYGMEREHGSLFRALMARRRAGAAKGGPAGPGGTLTSLRGGMVVLIEALARRLGGRLRLGDEVADLAALTDEHDRVVLSCPAWRAAPLVAGVSTEAGRLLSEIPGASLAVVATAYDQSELGGPPEGFGFLAPPGQGLRILGCLWTSSIYPGTRAPEGRVLLRTMVGGALDPAAVDLPEEALLDRVARDLEESMGLKAAPVRHWIFRHRRGIPQYVKGHGARLAEVARLLRPHPRLVLAGNSYRGISVNAVIHEAADNWGTAQTYRP
jgi:oxygen-dependent protoporphyrinogen oxidase